MLKIDRTRAFGWWLWLSALLFFGICVADTLFELLSPDSNVMMTFLSSGAMIPIYMISALIACLPFSMAYIQDRRTGAAVSIQLRCGRRRYLRSKLLCSALSGGLALTIGFILYIVLLNVRLSHNYEGLVQGIADTTFYDVSNGFSPQSMLLFYGVYVVAEFFAGMFYAVFGLMLSAFVPNVSIVLCSVIVAYRFMFELSNWVPEWTIPGYYQICDVGLGMWETLLGGMGIFTVLTVVCAVVFLLRAGSGLKGGAA